MAHRLDQRFNDFGGLDSRSNKLLENPKTFRKGSKNVRYTFQDEIAKRYGFQHKTENASACEWGLFEYKYRDVNTGESKAQTLGIDASGYLNRQRKTYLKLNFGSVAVVRYISLIYDGTQWSFQFLNSSKVELFSVNFGMVLTLDQLKTAINGLGIGSLTADVVDEDGNSVSSSIPAYLLDVFFEEELALSGTDIELNPVYYWERVPTPDGLPSFTNVPLYKDDPNYEGPTWVNSFNSIYITDGGFVFKYDGYSVFRSGMPKIFDRIINGFGMTAVSGGSMNDGYHMYKFQLCFVDANGVEISGRNTQTVDRVNGLNAPFTGLTDNSVSLAIPPVRYDDKFPVFACKANGAVDLNSGSLTITVDTGHNIEAGMLLRIPISNAPLGFSGFSYMQVQVASVTATTVVLSAVPVNNGDHPFNSATTTIVDNQWINGGWAADSYINTVTDVNDTNLFLPPVNFGAYVKVFRSLAAAQLDDDALDVTYHLIDLPLQYYDGSVSPGDKYTFVDIYSDTVLSRIEFDENTGQELPRSCRYLSLWQNQLVQAGRPVNLSILNTYYPTDYVGDVTNAWGLPDGGQFFEWLYNESDLCDFQSVYWSDPLNIEGFPRSGLYEEDFSNIFNDEIRGMGPNKEAFFVFKQRTSAYMTGTLATNDIVKEFLEVDVGCVAHKAVCAVQGSLFVLDPEQGFYSFIAGRLPEFIGYPVSDYFSLNSQVPRNEHLNLRRTVTQDFKLQDVFLCYIPAGFAETGESVYPDPTSSSMMFAFDYASTGAGVRGCWYPWMGINAAGGILATANDELLISEKSSTSNRVWKQKSTGSKYDYSDHNLPIEWNYLSAFIHFGLPTIDKSWHYFIINSIQGGFTLTVSEYGNYLDDVIGNLDIQFPVAPKLTVKEKFKCNPVKLSSVSAGFYNNDINADVRIQGWEIEYSADYDTGEVKK